MPVPKHRASHARARVLSDGAYTGQAPFAFAEELLPAQGVTILDARQPLEQIPALIVRFQPGELAIEEGRVPLVAVMFVPRRVGLDAARERGVGLGALLWGSGHRSIVVPARRPLLP